MWGLCFLSVLTTAWLEMPSKVVSPQRKEATLLCRKKGHSNEEEIGDLSLCLSPMGGFVYGLRWLWPQDTDGKVWSMQPKVSSECPPLPRFFWNNDCGSQCFFYLPSLSEIQDFFSNKIRKLFLILFSLYHLRLNRWLPTGLSSSFTFTCFCCTETLSP